MSDLECPKCRKDSGDSWSQCRGICPMPMSPYYQPSEGTMSSNYETLKLAIENKNPVAITYNGKLAGVLPFMLGTTADKGIVLQAFKRGEGGGWRFYYLDQMPKDSAYRSEMEAPDAWAEALGTLKKSETADKYQPPAFVTEVLVLVQI